MSEVIKNEDNQYELTLDEEEIRTRDENLGVDSLYKTSRNGKEMRKAYETQPWKSENEIYDNPAPSFTLTIGKNNLVVGEETRIIVNVEGVYNVPRIIWISSDISKAYVTDEGVVRATKEGNVTITAYDADNTEISKSVNIVIS